LQEELEREFHRAKRNNSSFSVLSLDVDGLKSINDKYGHQHGDRLLRQVAQVIKRHTRSSDVAARVGGDEFLLLATETDTRQAADVAQRILKEINANYIEISGNKHHLHISIGLAAYPRYGSIQDIIQKADQAMYQAKAEGRNRVVSAA
jgi:diguanylate cyclase (GGDEF)-like protein